MGRIRFLAVIEIDDDINKSFDELFQSFQEELEEHLEIPGSVTIERATVSDLTLHFPIQETLDEEGFDTLVPPVEVEQ